MLHTTTNIYLFSHLAKICVTKQKMTKKKKIEKTKKKGKNQQKIMLAEATNI